MAFYKKRTYSGVVLEQEIYCIAPQTKNIKGAKPKVPLKTREEKDEYNLRQSLRRCIRTMNNNFTPNDYYVTLTQDDEQRVDTFLEAKRVEDNYKRRLQRINPDAKIMIFMGRGKTTNRIHFHMVISGISRKDISEKWFHGRIKKVEHLREHNYYNRIDHGADYTGLAIYLFEHWTDEQGKGKRWVQTNNLAPSKEEKPEITIRTYSDKRPPVTPKGYMLVESRSNDYGYMYFKYVKIPQKQKKIVRRN